MKKFKSLMWILIVALILSTGCNKKNEEPLTETSSKSSNLAQTAETKENEPGQILGLQFSESRVYDSTILVSCNEKLTTVSIEPENFVVYVDGRKIELSSVEASSDYSLTLHLMEKTYHGQKIYLTYQGGKVISEKNNELLAFTDLPITNVNIAQVGYIKTIALSNQEDINLESVGGMCISRDGSIYLTDYQAGLVYHMDSDGGLISKWGAIGEDEKSFGENGPMDIEVLEDELLAIADPSKNRVIITDSQGNYIQKVGEPAQKDQLPIYDTSGFMTTVVKDYGYLYKPYQLSSVNLFTNSIEVFDERGVLQTFGEDDGLFQFYERGTQVIDADIIKYPDSATVERNNQGYIVSDTLNNQLTEVAYQAYIPINYYEFGKSSTAIGSYISPMDAKCTEDASNMIILDSGNCRVQIINNKTLLTQTVFGGYGAGAEQFIKPEFLDLFEDKIYVVDTKSMCIKVYKMRNETMTMSTARAIKVTDTAASPYLYFDNSQNLSILEKGIVYATHEYPTVDDLRMELPDTFEEERVLLEGLEPGTHYYARAYVQVESGIIYSYQTEFSTTGNALDGVRLVLNNPPEGFDSDNKVEFYAYLNGGDFEIGEAGYEVSSDITFQEDVEKISAENENGKLFAEISNENNQQCVFVRSYVKIEDTILYSRIACVFQDTIPQIIISRPAQNHDNNTLEISGYISSDFNKEITEVGVVYGENEDPTIDNNKVPGTPETMIFTVSLEGVLEDEMIYYRGYAITADGVVYGNGGYYVAHYY